MVFYSIAQEKKMNRLIGKLINGWKDINSGPAGRMEVAGIDQEGAQWNPLEGCKVLYGGRDLRLWVHAFVKTWNGLLQIWTFNLK